MATNLLLEGTDLEALLLRAHQEGGTAAKIVRAEKVRRGGFLGFFAREGFEVAVEIPDGSGAAEGAAGGGTDAATDTTATADTAGTADTDPLLGLAERASAAEHAALRALAALSEDLSDDETARADASLADAPQADAPQPATATAGPRPWLPAGFGADLDDDHDDDRGGHPPTGDLSASLLTAAPLPNVPLDLAAQVADPLLVGTRRTWAYAGVAVPAADDDTEAAPEFTALVDELRANHQGRHRLTGPRHVVEDVSRDDLGSFLPEASRGLRDDSHDGWRNDEATHLALRDDAVHPGDGPVAWHDDGGGAAAEEDLAGYVPEPGDRAPASDEGEHAGAPAGGMPPGDPGHPLPEHTGHQGHAAAGPVIVARATTIVPVRRPRSSFVPHPRHGEDDPPGAQPADDEPQPERSGQAGHAGHAGRAGHAGQAGRTGETDDAGVPGPAVEASWRLLRNLRPARRQPARPDPDAAQRAADPWEDAGLHEPELAPVHRPPGGFDLPPAAGQETGFGATPHTAPADRVVLEDLGIPGDWAARLRGGDRFTAVVRVLDRMPEPDIDPQAPVVAVVGSAAVAELEAHRTALDLPVGTRPRAVVTVPRSGAEERRSAIAAARNIRPVVIAVETDGYHDPGAARRVLRSVQADCVIAVVDATRPITETARWLEEFEHIDALAVDGALEVPDPAAVLGLDLPVVRLDGVPIDRFGWTALLCAHLVARDPAR